MKQVANFKRKVLPQSQMSTLIIKANRTRQ